MTFQRPLRAALQCHQPVVLTMSRPVWYAKAFQEPEMVRLQSRLGKIYLVKGTSKLGWLQTVLPALFSSAQCMHSSVRRPWEQGFCSLLTLISCDEGSHVSIGALSMVKPKSFQRTLTWTSERVLKVNTAEQTTVWLLSPSFSAVYWNGFY